MKVFAKTYPDETILQQVVAKLPWGHQIALLEKIKDTQERFWYRAMLLDASRSSCYNDYRY